MFSKALKIITPFILIAIIFLIAHNTYQKTQNSTKNPITTIPTNASLILKLNDPRNISNYLIRSNIWNKLNTINQIEIITKKAKEINDFFILHEDAFESNTLFISFHKVSSNTGATLFSTNIKSGLNDQVIE